MMPVLPEKSKPYLIIAALALALVALNLITKKSFYGDFFFGSQNIVEQKPQQEDYLKPIFEESTKNLEGNWSIAIYDLTRNRKYLYNEKQQIGSASIYKLAVMWTAYDAVNKGDLSESQSLGGITVETALERMITISDNESAVLLAEKLGWSSIEKLMKQEGLLGFTLTNPDSPTVDAESVANLLERIQKETAVTKSASQKMRQLLFSQQVTDRIPKYLPQYAKVGNKTGELENLRHDAGIVVGKNRTYIFVFLTQTPAPQKAAEEIADLSKIFFEALENNP